MDILKQIEYWRQGAEEDLAAALSLLDKKHFRHALFFAHLALEKMLKAHVTRRTNTVPPRIHHLERLGELSGLDISPERKDWLAEFGAYQIEGRYPDAAQVQIQPETARADLAAAEEMVEWLRRKL